MSRLYRILPRRRMTVRDMSARGVYTEPATSFGTLLRMAFASSWPWDAPTLKPEWVDRAVEVAARRGELPVEVRVPTLNRLLGTPWPDALSIGSINYAGVRMWCVAATSDSPAALVANMALAMRILNGKPDELVPAFERRERAGDAFNAAVMFIPGSVRS